MKKKINAKLEEDTCQVCGEKNVEDIRHVSVECFYAVSEVAPMAAEGTIFKEVPNDGSYWGTTYRVTGTMDKHRIDKKTTSPGGYEITHIETDQVEIPPMRLLEQSIYTVRCCKDCRADFLAMFGKWAKGELRASPDSAGADIPVRINGALRYLTNAEYMDYREEHGL